MPTSMRVRSPRLTYQERLLEDLDALLAALKARPAYIKAIELGGPITLPQG